MVANQPVSSAVRLETTAWEEGMRTSSGSLCTAAGKYWRLSVLVAAVAVAPLFVGSAALAQGGDPPALRLINVIPINGTTARPTTKLFSFDISFVDPTPIAGHPQGLYYLADRSNKAVDALFSESIVTQIFPNNGHAAFTGFTPCAVQPAGANDCAGPNGVVAAFPWLFVTDAPSRVLSFDLRQNPPLTVGDITTLAGEKTRG